jgi:hypothetical protein
LELLAAWSALKSLGWTEPRRGLNSNNIPTTGGGYRFRLYFWPAQIGVNDAQIVGIDFIVLGAKFLHYPFARTADKNRRASPAL